MAKEIRYGMVGGHNKAFIGDVHRKALQFDPRSSLVAGCFSTRESLNQETRQRLFLLRFSNNIRRCDGCEVYSCRSG